MVKAAQLSPEDCVIEIGPGKGVLTRALIESGASVIAIEKDTELVKLLQATFAKEIQSKKLSLLTGDVRDILQDSIPMAEKYKVVANIPYYITGELIRTFLEAKIQPQAITFLIQKEVAQRIVARDKKESILSLSVKVYGTPKIIMNVSAKEFTPPPKVDSAVLHIDGISRQNFSDIEEAAFFEVLKAGFAHKRKQLAGNLADVYTKDSIADALNQLKLPSTARAEDLLLQHWLLLTKLLAKK